MSDSTETVEQWLDYLYGDTPEGWLTLFAIDRSNSHGNITLGWAEAHDPETLATEAARLAPTHCVWYGVATRREHLTKGRGGATDCLALPGLWIDLDVEGPGHRHQGKLPLPPDRETALNVLDLLAIEPSAIVDTGGGLQAYWLFEAPESADEVAPILDRFGQRLTKHFETHGYHLDNVFDLPRVLRLPGTTNRKLDGVGDSRPVTIVSANGPRYSLDYFDQILDHHFAPSNEEAKPAVPLVSTSTPMTVDEMLDQNVARHPVTKPGDIFNDSTTCAQVLTDHGWQHAHADEKGEHWTRPGKNVKEGTSATIYTNTDTCVIWSSSTPIGAHLIGTHQFDPFGLYAALSHDGNHTAAARQLGNGQTPHKATAPAAPQIDHTEPITPDTFAPYPIGTQTLTDLPDFPTDSLPRWLAQYVEQLAEELQVPEDLPGMLTLAALATISGGRAQVSPGGKWREPLNIYIAVAMPPGSRKSPIFARVMAPIESLQTDQQATAKPEIAAARHKQTLLEKQLKIATDAAVKKSSSDGDVLHAEAAELAVTLDEHHIPATPQMLVDNITPEALIGQLAKQASNAIAVTSAEGDVFRMMAGGYSDQANLDVWLKGHAGDTLRVHRVGRDPEEIRSPALTIGVTVQPAVLQSIGSQDVFKGRGLTARFLYSVPESALGDREANPPLVDPPIEDYYHNTLKEIGRQLAKHDRPQIAKLTPEADAIRINFFRWCETRRAPGGTLAEPHLIEWASKLDGTILRLAGLLAIADEGHPYGPISAEVMLDSVALCAYLIEHASQALAMLTPDPAEILAERVIGWTNKQPGPEFRFTKRECFRAVHNAQCKTVSDLDTALALLLDARWLSLCAPPDGKNRGGRPASPKYLAIPGVLSVLSTVTGGGHPSEPRQKASSVSSVTNLLKTPKKSTYLLTSNLFQEGEVLGAYEERPQREAPAPPTF